MALKQKITKEEHASLPDPLKEHYKEAGGAFVLDTDEAAGAIAARDNANRERDEARAEAARLKKEKEDAEAAAAAAAEENARKKGDTAALEASWQTKLDTAVAAEKATNEKLQAQLKQLLVDNVALAIANEISVSPTLMLPHIKQRLAAELGDDTAVTRVLDAAGKPSALTVDDLKKEMVANKEFAAIIKGTNASGGGAHGNGGSGGGATSKKISEMSEVERVAAHKEWGAEEFNRRRAAELAA